eukprot:4504334-Amphidinium_carterae.1
MAGMLRIEQHQALANVLLRELHRAPPPGMAAVTHDQLQRADQECWKIVAEAVQSSLGPAPD